MSHTIFISDLHLDEQHTRSAALFFKFINTTALVADSIYILGDFFEVWIGDDQQSPLISKVKQSLKHLHEKGIKVYLMGGNRDFLIGKRFARETNCKLLRDCTTVDLYGQRVLLTHGDVLCTRDLDHVRFRKLTQNSLIKRLFLTLPLLLRKKIGEHLRSRSKQHTRILPMQIMDVSQEAVTENLQQHEARTMIHGHTHRPLANRFEMNGTAAERIVLGSWDRQGCFLKWYQSGKRELIFF